MKCTYMEAAYPTLAADDCCTGFHRHELPVFALATAFAATFQGENPSDEQIGWFLNDAEAVVDDFDPAPEVWAVEKIPEVPDMWGVSDRLTINGVEYVVPDSEWEPSVPQRRDAYEAERVDAG